MKKEQGTGSRHDRYYKWCVAAVVCMMAVTLCGCGGKYPELSDEQEQAVLKYAATLLYENDQNKNSRLMTEEEMILAMQRRAAHAYIAPTAAPQPEEEEDKEHSNGQGTENSSANEQVVETRTLAEFFGFSGIDISYQGYFLAKSYPEGSEDELYFAMDALDGDELLLLQYTITNQNMEAAQVDILNLKPRFRLFINDGGQINAMSTLLLDDMKTTNCTLQPGESCNVVVVFEVTEEEATSIQGLRLTVKTEEDSWTTELLESGTPVDSGWNNMQEAEQGGITEEQIEQQAEESEDGQQEDAADTTAENETDTPTTGERNALESARDYLALMPFSYNGLIEQLEYDQYTHDEAVYAADHCEADWNEQAGRAAKAYLEALSFSRDGLIEQLEFDGYTHEQAVYGAEQNGY